MKKRKPVKAMCLIFLCFMMVAVGTINSAAYIECDGKLNLYEWDEYEQTVLFDHGGASGNAYHSLVVKHKYIDSDRRVYLGISMEILSDKFNGNPEDAFNEIYISFNNSSEIILCSDMTSDFNEDEFYLDFGYSADSFGGCTYEVECVLKELEYDNILVMNIQLADHNGDTSQIYQIKIKSEELKEEESVSEAESIKEAEKESKKAEKEKTTKKATCTTKVKTTKPKETTTEFVTAVITEPYEEYSKVIEKNNRSTIIIGVACVVSSVAAMCAVLFKKEKKS
ncbi:MAG: hypothetical protein IKL16_00105 [Clostridia bacterium]|nr:hypothetical protein [Clostridia bacterium]